MMYWWGPMWGHMGSYYSILMFVLYFIWLLVLVGVFYLLVRLIKSLTSGTSTTPDSERETPMDILKRRYAAGEITKEQFEIMKEDLKDN